MLTEVKARYSAAANEKRGVEGNVLISNLSLSQRARNCLKSAGITTVAELLELTSADLMAIKNMGARTCDEILTFCKKIPKTETKCYLQNIAADNRRIPVVLLRNLGSSDLDVALYLRHGHFTIGDLSAHALPLRN
jgi:hypothetical protein